MEKEIKVGLVSPFLPRKDGIAIYSNNLITHMNLDGVKLIKIGDEDSDAEYKVDLKSMGLKNELKRIVEKENLDVIHVQYVPTLFGKYNLNINLIKALKLKIPVITTLHEVHYSSKGLRDFALSWIEKKLVRNSTKVIVHTPQQKEFLEKKCGCQNVVCIYHGLNFFDVNKRENKNILFFGFVTPLKGIEYLIKAMKELPDCQLKIVGHVPKGVASGYKEKLLSQIEGKENIKTDIRWIPEEDKKEYFKWADVVALPYRWGPYQSGILHNAMSFGVPVVVTRVGSVHEMVELFNIGKIVTPEDSQSLAEGVKEVFDDYDRFKNNIEEYRKVARWETISSEHKKLYLELA